MAFKNRGTKFLFITLGFVAMVLAYIGIILPGVPGIPFVLLTAFFFVRSSDTLYAKLLELPLFGKVFKNLKEKGEISLGFKLFVASQLWISITVAEIWLIHSLWLRITIAIIGIGTTILILRMGNRAK